MNKEIIKSSELVVVHAHFVKQFLHVEIETVMAFKIIPEKLQVPHVLCHWTATLGSTGLRCVSSRTYNVIVQTNQIVSTLVK